MKIDVLCSDRSHPVWRRLEEWASLAGDDHDVTVLSSSAELRGGDILFLVSCHEVIDPSLRVGYSATLVLHASDLPYGRGWSPHVWQILEGKREITVSLLEAQDPPDTGAIWGRMVIPLAGHELHDEVNRLLFDAECDLMSTAIARHNAIVPVAQAESGATFYRRRTPDDSRLDPDRSIADQFDLLRICDPDRYPAFFDLRGHRYAIRLSKISEG